jgi:hypothetical protein
MLISIYIGIQTVFAIAVFWRLLKKVDAEIIKLEEQINSSTSIHIEY